MSKYPKLFKTTVAGVGPFCVEFEDGEIITTRTEERQRQIAGAARSTDRLILRALMALLSANHISFAQSDLIDEIDRAIGGAAANKENEDA